MGVSNGAPKHANGYANGYANGKANGKANANANGTVVWSRAPAKPSRSFISSLFVVVARLLTWSAIFTILFRCPATADLCDETSPSICKYYFNAKATVTPHVQPYYDTYAAPYVDVAQPYYEALDSRVLTPAKTQVVKYGGPWVGKGREFATTQWEANAQPQITKAQLLAREQYDESVAPYIGQAGEVLQPYYEIARTNALQGYHSAVLPSYEFLQPYALKGYHASSGYAVGTALPAANWAWTKTIVFLNTAVWPQLREVYVGNVEPQLVRIGERLGRYKAQVKTKTTHTESPDGDADTTPSSFSKPTPQSSSTSSSAAQHSTETAETADDGRSHVVAPPAGKSESTARTAAREMVAEDLEMWQNKFAAQADEGGKAMEDRVDEIAKRMLDSPDHAAGTALVDSLDTLVTSSIDELKSRIASIVAATTDESAAEESIIDAIRAAGVSVRSKAQEIRDWRQKFDGTLHHTVVSAADVHFQILDETRNLALQQIGMRWAWTDGVTYKDWAKYHELKKTLTQWTEQLKQLIVSHPSLLEVQDASAKVEDEGMEIAAQAAQELAELKNAGHFKILAADSTDNFDLASLKEIIEEKERAKKEKRAPKQAESDVDSGIDMDDESDDEPLEETASVVSEEAAEQSTAASQSVSSVLSEGADATSEAEEVASSATDKAPTSVESVASEVSGAAAAAKESAENLVEKATEAVKDTASTVSEAASSVYTEVADEASTVSESASSVYTEVAGEASTAASSASSAVGEADSSFTIVDEQAETKTPEDLASAAVDDIIMGHQDNIVENATADSDVDAEDSDMDEEVQRPAAPEAATVKPAMFGAAAQEVPAERQPVFEDYIDTDYIDNAKSKAEAAYSNAVEMAQDRYSSAASVVSAQIYGTPAPVHEQLIASVSGAYDAAVEAASSRYQFALDAATGVYGTPTMPTTGPSVDWHKVEGMAASRLSEGRLWAEMQYSSAVIAMGLATPTPTAATDKFYDQAKINYYAGMGLAQERYSNFLSAASSAFSSITATPTPTNLAGTASSIASVASASAASVVNAAEEAAEAAYSAATENVASAVSAVDGTIGSAFDAASEQMALAGSAFAERWDSVLSEISGQVYGETPQIGWTDRVEEKAAQATNEAARQYDAVSELVSELLLGKEAPFTESVLAKLSAAYATAASEVGEKVAQATDKVKEQVQGKDEL